MRGQAIITFTTGDQVKVELRKDKAPNTVNNFVALAKSGYYDGLVFHRVIENFMIQGGCPDGTGMGGPGYGIKGEFMANGYPNNDLKHVKGTLSMARANHPDSAGSQFFVMHEASPHLDGKYAAFGQVIEGQEIVDEFAKTPTGPMDRPIVAPTIESIEIIENDDVFEEPIKL